MNINKLNLLYPAIITGKSSGREKNPCLLCKQKLKKDEEIVELYSSSYKGTTSYTNRFCRKCFMKVILFKFPELFNIKEFEDIRKEIMLNRMEGEK